MTGPALTSLGSAFPATVAAQIITDPFSPKLPAGNCMLLCADPAPVGIVTLLAWWLPVTQFLHELRNQALISNAALLQHTSTWAYMLVSGDLRPAADGTKTEVNGKVNSFEWRAIQGALLTIAEIGVQIIWMRDDTQLGPTLLWLAERDRGIKKIAPVREALFSSPAENVLTALPGIGPERAVKLLDMSGGNLSLALNLLTDPDQPLPAGVPASARDEARKVFNLAADDVIGMVAPEKLPF